MLNKGSLGVRRPVAAFCSVFCLNRKAATSRGTPNLMLCVAAAVLLPVMASCTNHTAPTTNTTPAPATPPAVVSTPPTSSSSAGEPELTTMDVAKAVMVTAELDFGPKVPPVAEALTQIERRYQPDDQNGRTFAILDADGWPTPEGRLHLQMHVSSEKPGLGSLVFKRTGEVLWRARIQATSLPMKEKQLTILMDNGKGSTFLIDGSNNPATVLVANVKELGKPVQDVWADGSDREFTFTYSACGCPVKAMVRRKGDRTLRVDSKRLDGSVRAADLPVMFPDDPAAVRVISALMRW
jgi:hypothetical protein